MRRARFARAGGLGRGQTLRAFAGVPLHERLITLSGSSREAAKAHSQNKPQHSLYLTARSLAG